MTPCPFESRLAAYHDGELPRPLVQEVERHLPGCAACRKELEALRGMSRWVGKVAVGEDLTEDELSRLHAAVDAEPQPAALSIGAPLLALAASVLLICGVWLMAIPAGQPRSAAVAPPAADWERMAVTLRAEPRGTTPDGEVARAQGDDQRMTDWMVENLSWNK